MKTKQQKNASHALNMCIYSTSRKRTIDKVIVQMSNDEVGRDTRHRVLVVIEPMTVRIVGAGQIDPGSATKLQNSAHEASRGHAVVPISGPTSLPR